MTKSGEVIVVTGGNGFLGQHLIKLLQERGDDGQPVQEIRCVDLAPFEQRLDYASSLSVRSFCGDIRRPETIECAFAGGVDCVFHCAALVDFQYPTDLDTLEQVNVIGTRNIIELCRANGISRLVYTSDASIALRPYMGRATFAAIVNQTENKARPPESDSGFLIAGYPASKHRAELTVLAADGTPLADGAGRTLRTVALRPTVMYGELDPYFVTSVMRLAHPFGQSIPRLAGAGGKLQVSYVGNVAWAHLRAMHTLRSKPAAIAGQPVFVTDDTPVEDTTRFCQRLSRAAPGQRLRLRPSWWSVPTMLTYFLAALVECLVRWTGAVRLPFSPCAVIAYAGSIILFSRLRAAIHLDYEPLFGEQKSIAASAAWYEGWYDAYADGRRRTTTVGSSASSGGTARGPDDDWKNDNRKIR